MYHIASLFLLRKVKGSMSSDAFDFNNIETRHFILSFFLLKVKAPKEIHSIPTETLGEHAPHMPPSKNGWPNLNMLNFPPLMRLVLDDL
jgi:hypothetical protein